MTVSAIVPQVTYVGNGATTEFSFTFEATSEAYIRVALVEKTTLVEEVLTIDVDYTVDLGAGEVTYPISGDPLPSTHVIQITRQSVQEQDVSFTTQGNFSPTTLEEAFDYITLLVQEVSNFVRAQTIGLKLPIHTVGTLPSVTSGIRTLILVQDASGGPALCLCDGVNWRRVSNGAIVS